MMYPEVYRIEHYSEIEERIAPDLCWYLVYEAVMTARETLKIEGDFEDLPKNKIELYHYALKVYLSRELQNHVFLNRTVQMSSAALEEALEYFALRVPHAPTFELDSYLNYLETWSNAHLDWTRHSPASFESLEIEVHV